jgi:hypothetical protein
MGKEFGSNEAALENRGFSGTAFLGDFKEWQRSATVNKNLARGLFPRAGFCETQG